MRRFLTQSEQFSWRVGMKRAAARLATEKPSRLYRVLGLSLPDYQFAKYLRNSHPSYARISELGDDQLGPVILNGLRKNVGPHWSKSLDWAMNNPWHQIPDEKNFQVILGIDHPGEPNVKRNKQIRDMYEQYPDEEEATLKRGTPVSVDELHYRGPGEREWRQLPLQGWQGSV